MKKLNILQINTSSVWGGGEVYLHQLARSLASKGYNLTLVVREEIADKFRDLDANIKVLPLKNSLDIISVFKLIKIIKENKVDIIHVHQGIGYWLGTVARNLSGRGKVVATRHILKSLGKSWIHKRLYNSIDKFITVSESVKQILITENKIPSKKINVVYNGVDFSKFNFDIVNSEYIHQEFRISNNNVIIGVVGRLAEEKNQKLLIKVAGRLKDKYSNIKYLIIGEDKSSGKRYRNKLEYLVSDLNVEDKVVFTGFRDNIPELINGLDILVIPSKKEAFGLVAIEAMAMKVPVIASEIGGLAEIIQEGITGLLVTANEVKELEKAIIKLVNNSKRREEIGENGYKNVKDKFSVKKMVRKIENLYLELN